MMTRSTTITPRLSRFLKREEGVAAIEFAFIAPLLVLFLLGTTQATQSLWANGKIAQTSSVLGDLISQESELNANKFGDIMSAAPLLIEPLPVNDLSIEVVSAIACYQNPNDIANSEPRFFVVWTDSNDNSAGPRPGSELTNPPEDLAIQDSNYIIRTTVRYLYEPPISREQGYTLDMEEVAYHQPRSQGPVSYPDKENTASIDVNDCNTLLGNS